MPESPHFLRIPQSLLDSTLTSAVGASQMTGLESIYSLPSPGLSDSTTGSVFCWIKPTGHWPNSTYFIGDDGASRIVFAHFNASGVFIQARNSGGSKILEMTAGGILLPLNTWTAILASWNTAAGRAFIFYQHLNTAAVDLTSIDTNSGTAEFSAITDLVTYATTISTDSGPLRNADVSQFWFSTDEVAVGGAGGFGNASVRAAFVTAAGRPRDLGLAGNLTQDVTPQVWFPQGLPGGTWVLDSVSGSTAVIPTTGPASA